MEDILVWEVNRYKLTYNPSTSLLSRHMTLAGEEGTLYTNLGIPANNILYYSLSYYSGYSLCVYLVGSRKDERRLLHALYLTEEQTLSLITFMGTVLSSSTTGAMEL